MADMLYKSCKVNVNFVAKRMIKILVAYIRMCYTNLTGKNICVFSLFEFMRFYKVNLEV